MSFAASLYSCRRSGAGAPCVYFRQENRRNSRCLARSYTKALLFSCSPVLLSKNVYMPTGLSLRQPRKTQIQNIICKTHIYNQAMTPGRKPGVAFFIISGMGVHIPEAECFPYFRNLTWSRFSRTRRICSRASLASGTEACTDSMPVQACSYRPSMASSTARA